MPTSPIDPRDSRYGPRLGGTTRHEDYKHDKYYLQYLRNLKTWDDDDRHVVARVGNTGPVIKLGPNRNIQDTEKNQFVQKTVSLRERRLQRRKGSESLPDTILSVNSERDPIDQLTPQFDLVSSICVLNGHGLIVAVKRKVELQESQCLTSQHENRIARTIEKKLIFNLKSQFVDVSFIVRVVEYGHILFVPVNLKDLPVCRVNKSICSGEQDATQTLLCIKEICKDNSILDLPACSVNKFIGTGKKEDCLKQSCFADIGKGDCNPDTLTDRLEEARCFRLVTYWKTILIQILKSCKVILYKGSIVICLLLVLGAISCTQPSNRTCSVSSHLKGIPSESLKVGKDMKLICRHNCSKGTPRWDQDKPIGRKLTYNGNVLTPNKQKIELEILENEYNIIFLNATFADINSTYTCHYGFDWTHISPVNYYTVLPTDKSTRKQSVYKNNVLNGTLEFEEVYPLPECVSYCDDKRQKEIPICKTCKIWKGNFYKVKLIFNIDFNIKICREENVSVRCAVGRNNFTYEFSKLPKRKKTNKETTGIWIGVIIGVIVLVGLGILYTCVAFERCRRGRNVEDRDTTELNESERSPNCVNDSQNNNQESDTLLPDETSSISETNSSNEIMSEQCNLINEISGETSNENRETLNQSIHEQTGMHSDCLTNFDSVAENTITKPVVKNESTPFQSSHNAVNIYEECNGTGQMCRSPSDDYILVHCDKRKTEDNSTMAICSELNDTNSTKENSLENTNVKASEQMSTSDVPNVHEESSFSGDLAGINKKRNAEEE